MAVAREWWACNCCQGDTGGGTNDFDCGTCGCCGGDSVDITIKEAEAEDPAGLSGCTCTSSRIDFTELVDTSTTVTRCFCQCNQAAFGDPDLVSQQSVYLGCSGPYEIPTIQPAHCSPIVAMFNIGIVYKCSATMRKSTGAIRRVVQVSISLHGFRCTGVVPDCSAFLASQASLCNSSFVLAAPGITDTPSDPDGFDNPKTFDTCGGGDNDTINFDLSGATVGIGKVKIGG